MIAASKRELRRMLRGLQQDAEARAEQSAAICSHIINSRVYREASCIAGYMPMPHEANILSALLDVLASGKTLALPVCGQAPHMTLRAIERMEELVPGAYGLLEPSPDSPAVIPADVDLFLVPLEAIDCEGFRLGKGGGYYDRLLSEAGGQSVGCALSWQLVERVPREPWDRPLTACASAEGLNFFVSNTGRVD